MQTKNILLFSKVCVLTTVYILVDAMPLFSSSNTAKSRLVYGKDDSLFGSIEEQQGEIPFGNVLDSGTGLHSLRWLATLGENKGMTSFTAITADEKMRKSVQAEADALDIAESGKILIGNWFGDHPLDERLQGPDGEPIYDTILADYLIGAMDGFSPYEQDEMIPKLARLLKPGGRLYIVGLEPLPDSAPGDANIVCKVRQIRDACILLAGHRCYREYPVHWIERQIKLNEERLGLKFLQTKTFPILYRHATITTQINVARSKLPSFPSQQLAKEMRIVLDELEAQSLTATSERGRIRLGFDYIVVAEKNVTKNVKVSSDTQDEL